MTKYAWQSRRGQYEGTLEMKNENDSEIALNETAQNIFIAIMSARTVTDILIALLELPTSQLFQMQEMITEILSNRCNHLHK